MNKEDIRLIIKAFYKVNSIVRASYDAHRAFQYAHTDEYLERILEQYNKLKKGGEDEQGRRKK